MDVRARPERRQQKAQQWHSPSQVTEEVPQNWKSELQRLLPLWPSELDDDSREGAVRILLVLARALREERRRGRAGHWCYDLGRHERLWRINQHLSAAFERRFGRVPRMLQKR